MVASRCIGRSLDCFLDVRMDGAVVPRLSKTGLEGVVCLALSRLHGDDGENDNPDFVIGSENVYMDLATRVGLFL